MTAQLVPLGREGDKRQVHAIEHELNRHEDGDDVALNQKPGDAARKQNAAQHQIVGKRDHQPSLRESSTDSGRAAKTTAPMIAISTRIDVASKGSRNW